MGLMYKFILTGSLSRTKMNIEYIKINEKRYIYFLNKIYTRKIHPVYDLVSYVRYNQN
ncbi:hypothetical protein ICG_00276 [Bacillus cereus BAG1X1-3]|nr:hypothetical protein ICG_00276 [Bacillus cereus BAG1X1-3]EOO70796.1 hypothetical protein IC7_04599 [Bacillus cereus BAG1O-1]